MNCVREDLKAHITDVLVGEALASLREQVQAHVEECASCRTERDQVAGVLGLLKEAPPWTADGGAGREGDSLSTIQRQKISSLIGRRGPSSSSRKPPAFSNSWLALAASLAAVGIALTLARQGGEKGLEAPAPSTPTSSIQQLPQAIEAPQVFPKTKAAPEAQSMTTPAAVHAPERMNADVAPEALREFKRQAQAVPEQGKVLDQAAEKNEVEPSKKDAAPPSRDQGGAVAGGVLGGAAAPAGPAATPARPAVAAPSSSGSKEAEIAALRKDLQDQPRSSMTANADEMRREMAESDVRAARARRLGELTGAEGQDKLRALGYSAPPRSDRPLPPPATRDMYFEGKGTNPFIVTEEDPQATFGLDVDTASYTLTRNYLNRGALPPASAVRVEEFVNAFPNNLAKGRGSNSASAFVVRADGAPNPLHEGYHILRVAMKAKDIDPRERKAAHLTFVIDVSGSMARENRLGLVKRSLALLVDKLDERDTIGIVVYGTNGRRILAPTSVENRDRIMAAINRLTPEGSTNLQDGLELGYEMAAEAFTRGASNRVILCTDGVANTGQTEADALLSRIRGEAKRGIDMMALGFGMGNYNDALLQRLADEGNGQYAYIDDLGEARAFFLRRLTSVLEVVAYDAKAQVDFNPARVERYRLIGYEKRDIADRDFRNDAVDAGEINSGHSVTALFEVKLKGRAGRGLIGTARIRYKTEPRSEAVEFAREIEDGAVVRSFDQASPAFRTAYVAARFAEHLRKSYWVKDEPMASLQGLADELPDAQPASELADLIRKAARLQKPQTREDW